MRFIKLYIFFGDRQFFLWRHPPFTYTHKMKMNGARKSQHIIKCLKYFPILITKLFEFPVYGHFCIYIKWMKFEIHRIVIGPKSKQISQIPIKTVLIILSLIIVLLLFGHTASRVYRLVYSAWSGYWRGALSWYSVTCALQLNIYNIRVLYTLTLNELRDCVWWYSLLMFVCCRCSPVRASLKDNTILASSLYSRRRFCCCCCLMLGWSPPKNVYKCRIAHDYLEQ